MVESVAGALAEVETAAIDAAAVDLALRYAAAIDAGPVMADDKITDPLATYGPKLLAILVELRLTPKARAAVAKGGQADDEPRSPLDELRARRAARAN